MGNITKLIRAEIIKQYKSVRKFSEQSGIPYSTISNALSKGIGGMSYETVIKICNILNLKQVYDVDFTVLNEHCYEICGMLSELDEHALHTLKTILKIEYERCKNNCNSQNVLNELSMAVQTLGEDS